MFRSKSSDTFASRKLNPLAKVYANISRLFKHKSPQRRRQQFTPTVPFLALPPEIYAIIVAHIPSPHTILILSSTCTYLRSMLCTPLTFTSNLALSSFDTESPARRAGLAAALSDPTSQQLSAKAVEELRRQLKVPGTKSVIKPWMITARSAIDKFTLMGTDLRNLPVHGMPSAQITSRSRQAEARKFLRRLADTVMEAEKHNFEMLSKLDTAASGVSNFFELVSSLRVTDAPSRYLQSFIMASYTHWLSAHITAPLQQIRTLETVALFLNWTRTHGQSRGRDSLLTLHTEINCMFISSIILFVHLPLSAAALSSLTAPTTPLPIPPPTATTTPPLLPLHPVPSSTFDYLPHQTKGVVHSINAYRWLPRAVSDWAREDGPVHARGFLVHEAGTAHIAPFSVTLNFTVAEPAAPLPPKSKRRRQPAHREGTFSGTGHDAGGSFEVTQGKVELTIGLVSFERTSGSDSESKQSFMGCVTAFGILGMCRTHDGVMVGHFLLRQEPNP